MKTLLILVRGDARTFYDLQQKSILSQLPCRCVLLVDRGNRGQRVAPGVEAGFSGWRKPACRVARGLRPSAGGRACA